ncbi:MAG: hypothetical protein QXO01_03715 [Nitrososphaerota archaeon]
MTQKSNNFGFREVLEWRALLYISSIIARLFGNSACNAIFFRLGMAEGCNIAGLLMQKVNPTNIENRLDLHVIFKELSEILIENNYVERFWFFESETPDANVKEYRVRVSSNLVLSMLLEQEHYDEDESESSLFCNFMCGMLKSIFEKFLEDGMRIIESECQLKNKESCEYAIRKI